MLTDLTTREIAELLEIETWRVRRLFQNGTIPEPKRFAGRRMIPASLLPAVIDALRDRQWLPEGDDHSSESAGA